MEQSHTDKSWQPDWFTKDQVSTVIFAFPDVYGRLMGKRMSYDYFIDHGVGSGMHACNYLMTVDIDMNARDGFGLASWEKGFGDFMVKPDLKTLRQVAWQSKTAVVLGDMFDENSAPVEESPRQVLKRQLERLKTADRTARLGSELEFVLLDETYKSARAGNYANPALSSDYSIDYHILGPARDEDVLGRIRDEMTASNIPVECSKGETGRGQHEVNLLYAEAMEMADRHVIYKTGAKDIADQQSKAISFMAKLTTQDAGNGFHIHTSLWDTDGKTNLFWDHKDNTPSQLFAQFLGGLIKYSRELTYFFAPTINSYKRYQAGSWAPTAIVCGRDNRTCGFRLVGSGNSFRVENRMPGADANPYLAFAATIAAGLAGVEENLTSDFSYRGNAYDDKTLVRLPKSLDEATSLLKESKIAPKAFGQGVVDFYIHNAQLESEAFSQAVTNWEHHRYFEQI
ncbi:MAG: glutamine synthetase [Proteobacteria bacterium]|nr:glutamine synthetase [Pseudomonadota bacterium]